MKPMPTRRGIASAVAIAACLAPAAAHAAPAWHEIEPAIRVHIVAALLALSAGLALLAIRRGTPLHRWLGRTYACAMLLVAAGSFWIRGSGGLSWIHALSVFTIVSIAVAWFTIRRRNGPRRVRAHAAWMIGTFVGLVSAGAFTLAPQRIIGQWLVAALG